MRSVLRFCVAGCLLLLGIAGTALAQRPYQIESVLPRVAQRGTLVDVVISGVQLADPRELVFYRPGIRCTAIGPVTEIIAENGTPVKYGLAHGGMIAEQTRCRLEIAPDCPVGEHPFHVRRGRVISVVSTFYVTSFPCVDEHEMRPHSNDRLALAVEIPLNVTVRGSIRQQISQDVDYYKVRTYAGWRTAVECDMAQIAEAHVGASEIDAAVRILDEQGNELASADDSGLHVQDPIVTAKSPANGYVYIEVKQSTFTPISGAAYGLGGLPYNLHVGNFNRPLAAYPAGGPVGEKLSTQLLSEGGASLRQIDVPNEPGSFDYFGDAPSPLKLRASPYANLVEPPPKPAPPPKPGAKLPLVEPPTSELPVALNGIITAPEEADRFRFQVQKGSRWRIRTFASALGSPLDPIVRLRAIAADGTVGEPEVEADDSTLTERDIFGHYPRSGGGLKDVLDPSFIFAPKLDGLYELEITDRAGAGSPMAVYRIEIEPATDGLACALYNQGIYVARGSRRAVQFRLDALQGNTYNGEIRVTAEGLPPGVTFHCAPIPAGTPLPVALWPAVFDASPTADAAVGFFRLVPQSVSPAPPVRSTFQWKAPFINQTGGDSLHLVALEKMACVVTDEPPFTIEVTPPTTALARNGELAIPVKIRRREGFVEPITVDILWLPFGVGKAAALTLEKDQTDAQLQVSADAGAKVGRWSLPVVASTDLPDGRGRLEIAAPLIELPVAEPFVELAASLESLRRGERKRYVWSVKPKNPFDGAATVRLLGLPKGVTQIGPPPVITDDTREIAFEIEAADEALLGPVAGVACEVVLQSGGQEIHQRSGNATLRIDPKL
jgi:hypothetical protein